MLGRAPAQLPGPGKKSGGGAPSKPPLFTPICPGGGALHLLGLRGCPGERSRRESRSLALSKLDPAPKSGVLQTLRHSRT